MVYLSGTDSLVITWPHLPSHKHAFGSSNPVLEKDPEDVRR